MIELGFLFLVLVALAILASASIKIVPEFQRLVVLRLGRYIGEERGPGFVFLIPFVDRPVRVDLREAFVTEPKQVCITKDNAPISIDFLIYWRIFDAASSVIKVVNFAGAAEGIATTTLRAVVGDLSLDDVLARREHINEVLRMKLDEVTDRWGVKVTAVEISEITPPREVQEAMTRQMSAERNRRAVVTEADGQRESVVMVAEGDKQSAILRAEGDRQAAILRAEGYALALEKIESAAQGIGSKTMSLQYLEALKALGASPATKFVLPMEFTNLLRPFLAHTDKAAE